MTAADGVRPSPGPHVFLLDRRAHGSRRARDRSGTSSSRHLPTVSVVIPARDDAAELDRCLRALAAQTVAPHEVVVVDNASTDGTAAVAARHGARVLHEPRVGIASAAATGYDAATGDVVGRLDADSRPGPGWVERVARTFATDDVDAVTGTGVFHDLHGPVGHVLVRAYLGAYYLLGHAAAGDRVVWGSSMAMRRAVWERARERVHRDDPDVHDDMDLALALAGDWTVRYDRGLVVAVSARSLRGGAQVVRRFRRAFRTLRLGWTGARPWDRWARRLGLGRATG